MEANTPRVSIQRGVDMAFVTLNDKEILDEAAIKELEKSIMVLVDEADQRNMLLDFSNVKFMSSAFLGLLVKIHKHLRERGGELKIRNVDPKIFRVFEITRLNKVFDIA